MNAELIGLGTNSDPVRLSSGRRLLAGSSFIRSTEREV
jgi:hypothetical protein